MFAYLKKFNKKVGINWYFPLTKEKYNMTCNLICKESIDDSAYELIYNNKEDYEKLN
jgi:hypothetical protein